MVERLGNALTDDQMKKVEILANDAASDHLVAGLVAVADLIDDLRQNGSEDDKDALDIWSIDAPTVTSLRGSRASLDLDVGAFPLVVPQRAAGAVQDGSAALFPRALR